jgi:hypothetical protein
MKVTKEKKVQTERMEKERHVAEERTDEKINTPQFKWPYLTLGKQIVLVFLLSKTEELIMEK